MLSFGNYVYRTVFNFCLLLEKFWRSNYQIFQENVESFCFCVKHFWYSLLPLNKIIDLYHLKFYVSLMFLSMNQAVKIIGIQMEKIRMPSWFLRDQVLILWFFHFLIQPKAPRCHSNFLSLHAHYFHLNYLSSFHYVSLFPVY